METYINNINIKFPDFNFLKKRYWVIKMNKILVLCFLALLSFSMSAGVLGNTATMDSSVQFKTLNAGTIHENGWLYLHAFPAENQYNIEWAINITIQATIVVTNLSANYYQFAKDYTFAFQSAYQKINGNQYSPVTYGLRYYDSNGNLLKTDNSSLSFSATNNVNKNTSKLSLATNPNGASSVSVAAYFSTISSGTYYSYISYPFTLSQVNDNSSVLYTNSSTWTVGGPALSSYSVQGVQSLDNYSVWTLQNNKNFPGFDSTSATMSVEQSTGLVINENITLKITNELTAQEYMNCNDFTNVMQKIQTSSSATSSKGLPSFILFELAGGMLLLVIVQKKRKDNLK